MTIEYKFAQEKDIYWSFILISVNKDTCTIGGVLFLNPNLTGGYLKSNISLLFSVISHLQAWLLQSFQGHNLFSIPSLI
ncbi:hypothetical protein SAMN04488027_11242 [Psychroflexus sediminis]|uniref:Uncharacterized protein n=1 Tax=Psychroflexus sediminis TaxID=470826 RepID=A0A1G7YHW1_9FLAO|nr:hypothetical protein SAMN04488027_11242 [Psychroflexus sediminis]